MGGTPPSLTAITRQTSLCRCRSLVAPSSTASKLCPLLPSVQFGTMDRRILLGHRAEGEASASLFMATWSPDEFGGGVRPLCDAPDRSVRYRRLNARRHDPRSSSRQIGKGRG